MNTAKGVRCVAWEIRNRASVAHLFTASNRIWSEVYNMECDEAHPGIQHLVAVVNPSGMRHRDEITDRICGAKFIILQSRGVCLTEEEVATWLGQSTFPEMLKRLAFKPMTVMCLAKSNALADFHSLLMTDLDDGTQMTSLVHASDSPETAKHEIELFFSNRKFFRDKRPS